MDSAHERPFDMPATPVESSWTHDIAQYLAGGFFGLLAWLAQSYLTFKTDVSVQLAELSSKLDSHHEAQSQFRDEVMRRLDRAEQWQDNHPNG